MKIDSVELIKRLSNANGVSGFEDEVVAVARETARAFCNVTEDSLRNLYLTRQAEDEAKPTVMVEGHSDEVGFMIRFIKPNGTLAFQPLGSWIPAAVLAQRVRVLNQDGRYLPGVVASRPPHFLPPEKRDQPVRIEDMVIDVGALNAAEVSRSFKIEPGAVAVPDVAFAWDADNSRLLGKAFDNRLGCAAVIETMQALANVTLNVRPVGVLSSQEEVGTRGVEVSARKVAPKAAIIFEGTPADDTFSEEYAIQGAMGRGPQIRHIDKAMITNPRFLRLARQVAHSEGIAIQTAVRNAGSTDGAKVHLSHLGVPTIVIGVPVRYAHTPYCYAALADYQAAVRWCVAIIKQLDADTIATF